MESIGTFKLPLPTTNVDMKTGKSNIDLIREYVDNLIAHVPSIGKKSKDVEKMSVFDMLNIILRRLIVTKPQTGGDFNTCKSQIKFETHKGKLLPFYFNIPTSTNFGLSPKYNFEKQQKSRKLGSKIELTKNDIEGIQFCYQVTDLNTLDNMSDCQKWAQRIFEYATVLTRNAHIRECTRTPLLTSDGEISVDDKNVYQNGLYINNTISTLFGTYKATPKKLTKPILEYPNTDGKPDPAKPKRAYIDVMSKKNVIDDGVDANGEKKTRTAGLIEYGPGTAFVNPGCKCGEAIENIKLTKADKIKRYCKHQKYATYLEFYEEKTGNRYEMDAIIHLQSINWGQYGDATFGSRTKLTCVQLNCKPLESQHKAFEEPIYDEEEDENPLSAPFVGFDDIPDMEGSPDDGHKEDEIEEESVQEPETETGSEHESEDDDPEPEPETEVETEVEVEAEVEKPKAKRTVIKKQRKVAPKKRRPVKA
ncbi:hypothetical protein OAG24_00810 [bacterium]|nr:hypothetical protein [bacterium]